MLLESFLFRGNLTQWAKRFVDPAKYAKNYFKDDQRT